jgi:hypothetical protein
MLSSLQPSLGTAPLAQVEGAAALDEQPTPQRTATAVRPNPLQAREDRSRMYSDGCLVGIPGVKSNKCAYGDPRGKRTMVLFGDSHAMQYFPAMEELADKHGWRLVALAKAECTPGETKVLSLTTGREYSECETWRERALQRIETMGPKTTVVMSGATDYTPVAADGSRPSGQAGAATLEAGYVATLTRIHRAGMETAVIKDPPGASSDIPSCVSQELGNLESCAFRRVRDENRDYDARAAESTAGAHLIDVTGEICPDGVCRAVIGNALVYRDKSHLSATFAKTLSPGCATPDWPSSLPSGTPETRSSPHASRHFLPKTNSSLDKCGLCMFLFIPGYERPSASVREPGNGLGRGRRSRDKERVT